MDGQNGSHAQSHVGFEEAECLLFGSACQGSIGGFLMFLLNLVGTAHFNRFIPRFYAALLGNTPQTGRLYAITFSSAAMLELV